MAKTQTGGSKADKTEDRKPAAKRPAAGKTAASKKSPAQPSPEELQAEIKARAHQNFLDRTLSGKVGDALSDWLQAEEKVKKTYGL